MLAPTRSHSDEGFLPQLVGGILFIKRVLFSPNPDFPPSEIKTLHPGMWTTWKINTVHTMTPSGTRTPTQKKGKKSHWPFCVGWRPVNNGTPTHAEWHNTRAKKSHWPFCVGWRPENNGTPTHAEWHNTKNRKSGPAAAQSRPGAAGTEKVSISC